MQAILKVDSVYKNFRQGNITINVLKEISLEVYESEILAIVGPSGAGKSTLLHIMGFLDRPTQGDVFYNNQKLSALGDSTMAALRNTNFGFVFQLYHLLPELNALENVLLPAMINKASLDWIFNHSSVRKNAQEILSRIGLSHRFYHRPNQLSVGEQQRTAIARSLIMNPRIVFCDEPTGSLDKQTGLEILRLITDLNREQKITFVIVTHDESIAKLAGRVLKIEDGRLVE